MYDVHIHTNDIMCVMSIFCGTVQSNVGTTGARYKYNRYSSRKDDGFGFAVHM